METKLKDQVVYISGASGGIGKALARAFADEGCKLVLHAHTQKAALESWVKQEGLESCAHLVVADVTDAKAQEDALEEGERHLGRIDAMIVCAGIWPEEETPLWEMEEQRIRRVLDVNLLGAILSSRTFLRSLAQRRSHSKGQLSAEGSGTSLTFIGSTAGRFGERGHCEYAASKAGLEGVMKTLKNEIALLDPYGRVNLVEPGWTVTDMTREHLGDEELIKRVVSTMPLRRIARAEDIARVCVSLASPHISAHVTGQVITVAGGMEGRALWRGDEIDARQIGDEAS